MTKPIFAVALFALAGCHSAAPSGLAPDEARRLLPDRTWIDRMPRSESDRLHVFRFIPSMGSGIYQDRTLYAGQFELFRFEHTGEQIRFDLPHRGERKTARYRIEEVQERPFDLKLTIEGSPRGPSVYYGSRGRSGELEALGYPKMPDSDTMER
jgi:hypothetical protein